MVTVAELKLARLLLTEAGLSSPLVTTGYLRVIQDVCRVRVLADYRPTKTYLRTRSTATALESMLKTTLSDSRDKQDRTTVY